MIFPQIALMSDEALQGHVTLGFFKQIVAELQAGRLSFVHAQIVDTALVVMWSDGQTITFEEGAPVNQGYCTCTAMTAVCRHALATAFLLRDQDDAEAEITSPWIPTMLLDEARALATETPRYVVAWVQGGIAPYARVYTRGTVVSFPTAYLATARTRSGQGPSDPAVYEALEAFNAVSPEEALKGALVTLGVNPTAFPERLMTWLRNVICGIIDAPLARNEGGALVQLEQIAERLDTAGWTAIAELARRLRWTYEAYAAGDARYHPRLFAAIIGEIVLRLDVWNNNIPAAPQFFLQGAAAESQVIPHLLLRGLGVYPEHRGVQVYLRAVFADAQGNVYWALFHMPEPSLDPKGNMPEDTYATRIAQTMIFGSSAASLHSNMYSLNGAAVSASGQITVDGKMSANSVPLGDFMQDHHPAYVHTTDEWLRYRRAMPSHLLAEKSPKFFVLPARGFSLYFEELEQKWVCAIETEEGTVGTELPYRSMGEQGYAALWEMSRLPIRSVLLKYDDGRVSPVTIWGGNGGVWTAFSQPTTKDVPQVQRITRTREDIEQFTFEVMSELGVLIATGLRAYPVQKWADITEHARNLGYSRLLPYMQGLQHALQEHAAGHTEIDVYTTLFTVLQMFCYAEYLS